MLGYLNDGQVATSEEMEEFESYKVEAHAKALAEATRALRYAKTIKDLAKSWNSLPATLKAELKTIKDECKNRLEGKSNENN